MEFGIKQLKKVIKPSKYTKKVEIKGYAEGEESTVITYAFRNQKDSHLTIPNSIWSGMKFTKYEDKVEITNLNGLRVITNESGWSRLALPEMEESDE